MSKTAFQRHFADILAGIRQPARLIGGESGCGPGFGDDPVELHVVLGFPDTYEIGISNQALQILYHIAGSAQGVTAERTYLPWVDAITAMRREGVPLLTLETWSPVAGADLLGLTLQHELDYTNVLEMLDMAGIPLHASDRTEQHPLVLAGGPACADFLPLSRFLDAVAVGDGEELFPEVLGTMVLAKREGTTRSEVKRLLSRIDGVYVPGVSGTVARRAVPRLEGAPYPESCLVPLTAGVHDRAWVEIMRGCTRGCRFCQAGMWYRPVRERSPEQILSMAEVQLLSSGHQELALASLSTTDYSCLDQVLAKLARDHPEVRVSLPSLRVDGAAVRLAGLASPTGPSLTFAPEAGSRRMWGIINKNVTEADVLAAAEEAFRAGRTTLKLYFMIGLPLEEDADVLAIADLCLMVRDAGHRVLGPQAGRLRLNVSVNNFVPKAFTPFQWTGMAARETLLRRQSLLRSRLRRPGIRLALHGVVPSYLEAALARGGEEMGAVIEEAWRKGARFDSWTEEFKADAWREAFESAGTSAETLATMSFPRDLPLPWDVISGAVDRGFLWTEWEKAGHGESTADCRWEGCSACGACDEGPANDLAAAFGGAAAVTEAPRAAVARGASQTPDTAEMPVRGAVNAGPASRRWRYVATFSVTGIGRFVGHLDRTELFRRAVRRGGGRLALSTGLRPKPLLRLALPLAVGVEGLRELAEFELAEEADPGFFARLAASLPGRMRLLAVEPCDAARSLPARVVGASYEVRVSASAGRPAGAELWAILATAAGRFGEASELVVEETREGRVRRANVKNYVDHVSVKKGPGPTCTLSFRAAVTPAGTARPERVVETLGKLAGTGLRTESIKRTRIHLS